MRYEFGALPAGRLPTAPYGARTLAFVIDWTVLAILPIIAIAVLRGGPRQVRSCDLTAEGNIAVLGQDAVTTGLCEFPTTGTIATAALAAVLGVALWFLYVAHEGRTGQTLGKAALRIAVVDAVSGQPLGAAKGIGRGLIRGVLGWGTLGIGFVVDHLWPLWDPAGQALHDKAVEAVVVPRSRP